MALQFGEIMLDVKTTYSTRFLIEKLEENHRAHKEDYAKAVSVYTDDVEEVLKELKKLVARFIKTPVDYVEDHEELTKGYNKLSRITKPVDADKMYKQYIELFSNTTAEEIELTMAEANAIINDEWDWARTAKISNSSFSSRYVG